MCRCGYEEHRDVHGVRNILNKALHGAFKHWNVQMNLTYLRIA
nr:transposase [Parageobacillus caldoxylosilyticus]